MLFIAATAAKTSATQGVSEKDIGDDVYDVNRSSRGSGETNDLVHEVKTSTHNVLHDFAWVVRWIGVWHLLECCVLTLCGSACVSPDPLHSITARCLPPSTPTCKIFFPARPGIFYFFWRYFRPELHHRECSRYHQGRPDYPHRPP